MKPNKIKNKEEADASRRFMEGAFSTVLKERDSTNVSQGLSDRINDMLDEAKQRGFHDMGKLNKMVAEQFAHQAVANEDEDILQFINEIQTGPRSFYGQTIAGQNLIQSTTKRIYEDQDRKDRLARQQRDDYRKELGFSFQKRYGELRKLRREGELSGEEWEKAFETLKNEADASGFFSYTDSFMNAEEARKTRAENDRKITYGDPRLKSTSKTSGILEMAATLEKDQFYKFLIENDYDLDDTLLAQLSNLTKDELQVTNDVEYKNTVARASKLMDVPRTRGLTEMEQIFAGTTKPRITPKYFETVHDRERKIERQLEIDYYDVAAMEGGSFNRDDWTPEQDKAWEAKLDAQYQLISTQAIPELEEIIQNNIENAKTGVTDGVTNEVPKTIQQHNKFPKDIRQLHALIVDGNLARIDDVPSVADINPYDLLKEIEDTLDDMTKGLIAGSTWDSKLEDFLEDLVPDSPNYTFKLNDPTNKMMVTNWLNAMAEVAESQIPAWDKKQEHFNWTKANESWEKLVVNYPVKGPDGRVLKGDEALKWLVDNIMNNIVSERFKDQEEKNTLSWVNPDKWTPKDKREFVNLYNKVMEPK